VHPDVHFDQKLAPVTWQLVVDEPIASAALDTDRILVRPGGNEIKYFANSRWSERAPALVQSHLIRAFDQSNAIIGVGRQTVAMRGDYDLQGELNAFDAIYGGGTTPMARVAITLKIVREPSEQIIAARSFTQEERAVDPTMSSIAAAFQDALGKMLDEAVPWVLATAQADYEANKSKFKTGAPFTPPPRQVPAEHTPVRSSAAVGPAAAPAGAP
jgi:cholesterol transport system auxiliary component